MKLKIDKEELYNLYIIKNLSAKDIANIYNVSGALINLRLKELGIKKDRQKIVESISNTMEKKYGVRNIFQKEDIKNKIKETIKKKYGVENISQLNEIKQKKKETIKENYGVDSPMKSKEIKEKAKQTIQKKYNVDNPMKNLEVQNKLKKVMKEKYGVEFALQSEDIRKRIENKMLKKYGVRNILESSIVQERIKDICNIKYGVPYFCMTKKCKNANGFTISKINNFYSTKLKENNIENKLEYNLKKFSYDIKLLDRNILIEINPTYTHNSTKSINYRNHEKKPLNKDYHYNKTLCAKENGYRCIHIWDWDDMNKIINMIKEKEKIYARKCEIKEVSKEETKLFLEEYHLQGNCNGQEIRLGLYYNNVLVELMTFGKPRYNKKYEYELLRLCSHKDYVVIGGSKKLFNNFIKKYNPKTIVSYCDNSKFDGEIYNVLGFNLLDYGKPSKHWYNMKTKKHITDNLLRQRGFDQLFKANYGKGTSNEELMKENGFVEVYDCGQSIYLYNK